MLYTASILYLYTGLSIRGVFQISFALYNLQLQVQYQLSRSWDVMEVKVRSSLNARAAGNGGVHLPLPALHFNP